MVRDASTRGNVMTRVKLNMLGTEYSNGRGAELSETVVAISQPTFLPWLGYFSIIDASDSFVFLDDVAFSRQSWQQRNRVRGAAGLQWLKIPVMTSNRVGQLISETEIDTRSNFPKKQVTTLQQHYGKSRNWDTLGKLITSSLYESRDHRSLSQLNCTLISEIAKWLSIETRFHLASQLKSNHGRTEKLASIASGLGAKTYLSTAGSVDYLLDERESFTSREVRVEIHQYESPVYSQRFQPFIGGASVIDLIFSDEPDPLKVIRSGRKGSKDISSWIPTKRSANFSGRNKN